MKCYIFLLEKIIKNLTTKVLFAVLTSEYQWLFTSVSLWESEREKVNDLERVNMIK